jgi:hypothetical protein
METCSAAMLVMLLRGWYYYTGRINFFWRRGGDRMSIVDMELILQELDSIAETVNSRTVLAVSGPLRSDRIDLSLGRDVVEGHGLLLNGPLYMG